MKKAFIATLTLLMVFSAMRVDAAKKKFFTGKVTYKISFAENSLPEEAQAMLPKTMTMYIGENHVKTVLFTQLGKQSSIVDLQNKTKTGLMEVMGEKYAVVTDEQEIQQEIDKVKDYKLEVTSDTREIAGYTCHKIQIVSPGTEEGQTDQVVGEAWVTNELNVNPELNFSNSMFHNVDGLLMQFQLDAGNGLMMEFTATEVEKEKIKEKEFDIPDDYQKVTREELMKKFGG